MGQMTAITAAKKKYKAERTKDLSSQDKAKQREGERTAELE